MDDQYLDFPIIVFLDSNVVLEGLPLNALPWETVDTVGPILILLTPTLLQEVDSKKRDGRLAARAREFNRMVAPIASTGRPMTLLSAPIRVDIGLAICRPIDWSLYDDLDPQRGDARIVAEVLNVAGVPNDHRLLVSQDINPLFMAQRHGLRTFHVPDTWLPRPEPSVHEKEAMRLRQRLTEYERKEPELRIRLTMQPETAEVYRVEGLTEDEETELIRAILARNPKPEQQQSQSVFEIRHYDATLDDRYKVYATTTVPRFVERYTKHLELLFGQVSFKMVVDNPEQVRADRLKIDVQMVGGWLNERPIYLHTIGPSAPRIKNYLDSLSPFRNNFPVIPGVVGRHEVESEAPLRSPSFTAQCEDFRPGQEWVISGAAWLDPYYEGDPLIIVRITAANLQGIATEKFTIKRSVHRSHVSDLVDMQTGKLVKDPHVRSIVEEAYAKNDYTTIEWERVDKGD